MTDIRIRRTDQPIQARFLVCDCGQDLEAGRRNHCPRCGRRVRPALAFTTPMVAGQLC